MVSVPLYFMGPTHHPEDAELGLHFFRCLVNATRPSQSREIAPWHMSPRNGRRLCDAFYKLSAISSISGNDISQLNHFSKSFTNPKDWSNHYQTVLGKFGSKVSTSLQVLERCGHGHNWTYSDRYYPWRFHHASSIVAMTHQ